MAVNNYIKAVRKNNIVPMFVVRLIFFALLAVCFFRDDMLAEQVDLVPGLWLMIPLSIIFTAGFIIANTRVDSVGSAAMGSKVYMYQYHPLAIRSVYLSLAKRITPYVAVSVIVSLIGSFMYDCGNGILSAVLVAAIPYLVIFIVALYYRWRIGRRSCVLIPFVGWLLYYILIALGIRDVIFSIALTYGGIMRLVGRIFVGTGSEAMVFVTFQYETLAIICKLITALFVFAAIALRKKHRRLLAASCVVILLLNAFTIGINILNYSRIEGDSISVVRNGVCTEYTFSEVNDVRAYKSDFGERKLELDFSDGTKTTVLGEEITYSKSFSDRYGTGTGDLRWETELLKVFE